MSRLTNLFSDTTTSSRIREEEPRVTNTRDVLQQLVFSSSHDLIESWLLPLKFLTDDGGARLTRDYDWHCMYVGRAISFDLLLQDLPLEVGRAISNDAPPEVKKPAPHQEAIRWILDNTGLSRDSVARLLSISRQTVHSWERSEPISEANLRRLLGVHDVLKRAAILHPPNLELVAWLHRPQGMDGRSPASLIEAGEIDKARFLAMSTPSPQIGPIPRWVRNKAVPRAFRAGSERLPEAFPPEHDDTIYGKKGGEQAADEMEEEGEVIQD